MYIHVIIILYLYIWIMDGPNTPNLCYHAYIKGLCVYMYTLVKSNYAVNIIGTCTCMFQENKGSCFASANLMMLNPGGNRNMNSTRQGFIHDFFLGGGKDCMGGCGRWVLLYALRRGVWEHDPQEKFEN